MTIHTRDLTRSFGYKIVLAGVDLDLGPGIHGPVSYTHLTLPTKA